jgi:hypothetical protein
MTKRYYIDDPLQALMGMRDFGMVIEKKLRRPNGEEFFSIEDFISVRKDIFLTTPVKEGKWYIHPDSLHLLEPQVDDWASVFSGKVSQGFYTDRIESIVQPNDEGYPYVGDGRIVVTLESTSPNWKYIDDIKIIRRRNKHFPEIKWEEV